MRGGRGFASEAQAHVHGCYRWPERRLSSAPSLQRPAPAPGRQDPAGSDTGTRSTAGPLTTGSNTRDFLSPCPHLRNPGAMRRRLPGESSSTERKRLDRVSMFLSLENDKRTVVRLGSDGDQSQNAEKAARELVSTKASDLQHLREKVPPGGGLTCQSPPQSSQRCGPRPGRALCRTRSF